MRIAKISWSALPSKIQKAISEYTYRARLSLPGGKLSAENYWDNMLTEEEQQKWLPQPDKISWSTLSSDIQETISEKTYGVRFSLPGGKPTAENYWDFVLTAKEQQQWLLQIKSSSKENSIFEAKWK